MKCNGCMLWPIWPVFNTELDTRISNVFDKPFCGRKNINYWPLNRLTISSWLSHKNNTSRISCMNVYVHALLSSKNNIKARGQCMPSVKTLIYTKGEEIYFEMLILYLLCVCTVIASITYIIRELCEAFFWLLRTFWQNEIATIILWWI